MKLIRGMSLVVVAASALALTACSTGSKPAANSGYGSGKAGATAGRSGARTFGLRGQGGYKNSKGFVVNSKRAPSNQTYYFAFDKSGLNAQEISDINAQSAYLAAHPSAKIRLEGNTDNRGSREYNIGLGWRRDQAVSRIMEQQGVKPGQLQMVSYGKEHPVAFGNNENSWALNRRVNLIYKAK